MIRSTTLLALVVGLLVPSSLWAAAPTVEASTQGSFHRVYWYQPGLEHGNPRFDGRFRVNAPDVVLDSRFALGLPEDHPDLVEAGLADFHAQLSATPGPDETQGSDETILVRLEGDDLSSVAGVDFIGHYEGYDENGITRERDWHFFTKNREIQAHLGSAAAEPFALTWDTSMLPAQGTMSVMARVSFRGHPDLRYSAAPVAGFGTPQGRSGVVSIHHCSDDTTTSSTASSPSNRICWRRAPTASSCSPTPSTTASRSCCPAPRG